MKRSVLVILMVALISNVHSQSSPQANLPGPQQNIQTLPTGSYIIAMDNTWQMNDDANVSKRFFNLKAYGLIVFLLNNNVKVKRVIRTGKIQEGIDFSVSSSRIKPTADVSSASRDFKSGPFVISAADLPSNIDALIDYYNNTPTLSGITNANYKVKVYKASANVQVDVRYDLTGFRPKAGIMDDGGNWGIHENYFKLAGVPQTNYAVTFAANLTVKCFTFASEPHNDKVTDDIKNQIKQFVLDGGNFLAQCAAVPTYENVMKFHTDGGIKVTNAATQGAIEYPNPDLAYSQIEGLYGIRNGGSCQNWTPESGSSHINNSYGVVTGKNAINQTVIGASACKLTNAAQGGGMVFYLGSHSYSSIDDYYDINGMRLYMNAFLTPPLDGIEMNYTYKTSYKRMKVNAPSGPSVGYPVKFQLFADKGYNLGTVDTLDVPIGQVSINNAGQMDQDIYIPDQYAINTHYVMVIEPSSDCVAPAQTVQPPPFTPQVLPVSFLDFTGRKTNNAVLLSWKTAQEINTTHFEVEYSVDGNHFEKIETVKASGRSSGSSYQFTHNEGKGRINYYRLKVIDADMDFSYSTVAIVRNDGINISLSHVYPNPFADELNISISSSIISKADVYLYDMEGRVMRKLPIMIKEGTNSLSFQNLQALGPGTYMVAVKGEEINFTAKVVKGNSK